MFELQNKQTKTHTHTHTYTKQKQNNDPTKAPYGQNGNKTL